MGLDNIIGEILDGKYKIERQLGKGGMGTVYLATHIGTERPVALKVIASEFMKREEFVERFRREARAAGRLRHPNVVDVTDFGFSATKNGDVAYLVMEYLDGCTLGEILEEEKKLPVLWTVDILEQVSSAVHEAHEQGIIHRDLKPDNIWLEPNQRGGYTVKVLDFGIAKLEETHIVTPDDANFEELKSVSDTQLIGHGKTVSDAKENQTMVEKKNSTMLSESSTIALENKTQNFDSEAGTVIQTDEPFTEKGTAIITPSQPAGDSVDDSSATKIISEKNEGGAAATKLISDQIETDEKNTKSDSTARSLVSAPSTAELTRVGAVLGTPLYMSPEQCRGEHLTVQSDIYSLAVIVYQMLEGKLPFDGDYKEVMEAHKTKEPPPLKVKKVPKKLKYIVMKALSKDPQDRPASAEAFANKIRANSEGIGNLLRRSLVIYSENLPKFMQITFLIFLPLLIINVLKMFFGLAVGFDLIGEGVSSVLISVGFEIVHFFISIVSSAFLVGIMTWVVAHYLAYPLRPIQLSAAFGKLKTRWKPLALTVGLSTIISFIGYIFLFIPGIILSALFMLIAPSVMMEDVKGKAAFRRSIELTKRAFRTVFATAMLVYVIPLIFGLSIGIFVALANTTFVQTMRVSKMKEEMSQMKKEGVKPQPEVKETPKPEESDEVIITVNKKPPVVLEDSKPESMDDPELKAKTKKFGAVTQSLSQIILFPAILLLASITSVITGLLYFKTRQTGGETMQDLLEQFEEDDNSGSNWQKRVRQKILESAKSTGGRKIVSRN